MQVLHKNILIRIEEKQEGLLVIPDSAKEKPQVGEVCFVGNEVLEVKVGDFVLFKKYAPVKIQHEQKDLYIIQEEDIMAITEKGLVATQNGDGSVEDQKKYFADDLIQPIKDGKPNHDFYQRYGQKAMDTAIKEAGLK